MKPSGRSPVPLTDKQLDAVNEYLKTDLGLNEVAKKYGTTKSGLAYWLKKYKKQQGEKQDVKEDKRGEKNLN